MKLNIIYLKLLSYFIIVKSFLKNKFIKEKNNKQIY